MTAQQTAIIALCLIPLIGKAQRSDQVLPDGSVIHRRAFTYPQCVGPIDVTDWVHDPPCAGSDIGYIDQNRKFHPVKPLPDKTQHAVTKRLVESGMIDGSASQRH